MTSTAADRADGRGEASPMLRTSLGFLALAVVLLFVADIEISTSDPWTEFGRMARGVVTPDFTATEQLFEAILMTVAFALLGVAVANVFGFLLSLVFHYRIVRTGCAFIRAIHELFWAMIFLQIFGLSPLTGILAIAIPYSGIIAKVYSEILEEADHTPLRVMPHGTGSLSVFLFARLPEAWTHFKTYSLYRLECGLRSSAVLGFVGLPTLGYHLESAFRQGHYSEVSALLILFYVIIATLRRWMHRRLLPLYLIGALFFLPAGSGFALDNIIRFLTSDIVPHPIRVAAHVDAAAMAELWIWFSDLFTTQALPGIANTLVLTMIALVGAGIGTLAFFPLVSPKFLGPKGRTAGHVFLVVVRSTPEYILAYVFLQLWGPSMAPAIVALSLHNAGIIGHLIGRHTETLPLRPDSPKGLNLYAWEVLPRIYPQFLAFLFYRWEVILRETAILGILGIPTLGFFVDSAFADIRYDRALVLILITALLNIAIDMLSRRIRAGLRLKTTLEHG
ncbi:MAG: ABC transporter permease [Alphaproteobacteria bacterium]